MRSNQFYLFFVVINLCFLINSDVLLAQMPVTVHPNPPGYTSLQSRFKNDMQIDANNQVWMGFREIGLGKYDGANWVMFDSLNNGLLSNNVLCIDFDGSGNLWIGTQLGASKYDGNSWTHFTTSNSGLPADKITAIHCEGTSVWFGTNTGLAKYDGSNWLTYNTGNSGLINDTITTIITHPNGVVWTGTQRGVSKFDNGIWTNYDASNSIIPTSIVHDLEFDIYGNTWISSFNEVFVVTGSGQVLNFQGDLYKDELPVSHVNRSKFAKDNLSRIIMSVYAENYLLKYFFRFDNLSLEILQCPDFFVPGSALGFCFDMNSNNQLWYCKKVDGANAATSFDFDSYQPLAPDDYNYNFDSYKSLDINDVQALMMNQGDMHWDRSDPKYEVPKGSGKHSVFASGLWIGGLDSGGQIHVAASTYRQTGQDYWPGPISGIDIPFDSASCHQYNKIWKISKWEVEAFKYNFLNGSVSNGTYAVPKFFLSWPAKGNYNITDDKAPFVDYNLDNIYNPYDGDYPLIKGDQMLFWMFNDSLGIHEEAVGPKLGVEVHASAYAYSCPGIADSNLVLNRTTLYNYKLINRSGIDYFNFFSGLYCDPVLGYSNDNFIGCDTILAAGFGYNGDNDDETGEGYGLNPPMQNVVILKGHLADIGDGIDNNLNGIVDEPNERTAMNHFHTYININGSPINNPILGYEFYRYMQSLWLNGTPVTYGGSTGYNPGGGIPCNFIFPGVPYDTGWTEINAGNPGQYRRMLLTSGPVSFPAGGELTIDFAYVFTRDSLNPNGLTTSVARNIADVQRVRSWFDNDNFPSCLVYTTGIEESHLNENKFLVIQPNPVTEIISFRHNFLIGKELNFTISDISGRVVKQGKLNDDTIDFIGFENGVYLLNITDGNEFLAEKFFKMDK